MPHQPVRDVCNRQGLTVPITVVLDNARYQRCRLVQANATPLAHDLHRWQR